MFFFFFFFFLISFEIFFVYFSFGQNNQFETKSITQNVYLFVPYKLSKLKQNIDLVDIVLMESNIKAGKDTNMKKTMWTRQLNLKP